MSLVVLACDPANLQIVNGIAECSQWIAVEHTISFFDVYMSSSPQQRADFNQAIVNIIGKTVVFLTAVYVIKRIF